MEQNGKMYQMAAFDLNKPVDVTIIFDDSDEEHIKSLKQDITSYSDTSPACNIAEISKTTQSSEKPYKTESCIKECIIKEIFDTRSTEVKDIFSLSKFNDNAKRVLDDFSLVIEKDEITSPYFSNNKADRIRKTSSLDCTLHENDAKRICLNNEQITTKVSNNNNHLPNSSVTYSNTSPVCNSEDISKTTQSSKNLFKTESCLQEECTRKETFDTRSTEVIDIGSLSKSNNDAKRLLEDFSLVIEKDEITLPYNKNRMRKISSSDSIHENGPVKRVCLNKDRITTNVTDSNNSATYSNTIIDNRSSIFKDTFKNVAVILLRVSDTLQRYESSSINNIFKFYFRNYYYYNTMITSIENIINLLEKHADFSSKFINYALVLCNSKFSYNYLLKIFNEMVMWVKRNKHLRSNNMTCSTSGTQPEINNKDTSSRSTPINKISSHENKTCIYSNGQPGSEISITIDPTLLRKYSVELPNSTYVSTNVRNSITPGKTKTTMVSDKKNIGNTTLPHPSSKKSPLPINIKKKIFERNPILKENLSQYLPNNHINNPQAMIIEQNPHSQQILAQNHRTYQHPINYSQLPQTQSTFEQRDTLDGYQSQLLTNNEITSNSHVGFQPMLRDSSLQHSSFNGSKRHSQQNIHRNDTVSNQFAVYNMPGLPYVPTRVLLPATRQPQYKESRQYVPQTTRPPPPYTERNHQIEPSIPYQVQQTQPIQNQNVDHSIYHHHNQQSNIISQAPRNNVVYHPSCYPVLLQELNQSVPKPPPRDPQIQTMPGPTNQWINQTRFQNNNIETPTLQQLSDNRNRMNQELIRSTSTDSGFTSPLNFNTSNDKSNNEFQEVLTPLITHVTSLNPDVVYIDDGPCSVCAKLTKTKCLGCYNCYYCSIQCQQRDWKNHQNICKTRNE